MKTLNPYINFSGKCEEALEFYKECFDGEIIAVNTFGDCPEEMPEESRGKIMHAEFRSEDIYFMATDGMPGCENSIGNNISLSISLTNEEEQTKIFSSLTKDGTITMPLENTFWGARFEMLVDQFGVNWMLNCQNQ